MNNIRIVTSTTWDEFTFFAGGHGDIVSMGTLEVPVLEQETELKTVTFGKYNALRDSFMTTPDSGFETIEDIPTGSTLCVASPVSATGFWAVAAKAASVARVIRRNMEIVGGKSTFNVSIAGIPGPYGGSP